MRTLFIILSVGIAHGAIITNTASCEVTLYRQQFGTVTNLGIIEQESYATNPPPLDQMCLQYTLTPVRSNGVQAIVLSAGGGTDANGNTLISLRAYASASLRFSDHTERHEDETGPYDLLYRTIYTIFRHDEVEAWFVVTGGSGQGELRGEASNETHLSDAARVFAGTSAREFNDMNFHPVTFSFTFGVPFRMWARTFVTGRSVNNAFPYSDSGAMASYTAVYDSQGNRLDATVTQVNPTAIPEPGYVWLLTPLLAYGAVRRSRLRL